MLTGPRLCARTSAGGRGRQPPAGGRHGNFRASRKVAAKEAAKEIAAGKILGWFQGRAEWGPRALGNRSIVADPRRADMKDILNARIKHREIFRPFAPSILAEATGEWFDKSHP